MQLFYSENLISENQLVSLDAQESLHISKVLRKQVGDTIFVSNGKGDLFETIITSLNKRSCNLESTKKLDQKDEISNLSIAIAPTKNIARIEWFVEKSVEIGIKEIKLFISQNSERREIKTDRLNLKALSAMKQSLKLFLPEVYEAQKFKDLLKDIEGKYQHKLIAYCGENTVPINTLLNKEESTIILIGPEGGFSESEVKMAKEKGFKAVSLGKSRLRTETAGIFVVSVFNALSLGEK